MDHILEKDWVTAAGLRAVVIRQRGGLMYHRCGYVGAAREWLYGGEIGEWGWDSLSVHGGVTYSDGGPGSTHPVTSDLWWLGFDTAHGYETPAQTTLEFCVRECESLATQLVRSNAPPAQNRNE